MLRSKARTVRPTNDGMTGVLHYVQMYGLLPDRVMIVEE
jgi:hypothetical protein